MPSWKKILQSGSAVHVLNITASSLPNLSQPNIIGYDTTSGRFTYFSTSSLGSGGSIIGGSGTTNYITRWSGPNTITTSSIYESGSNIGIGTTTPSSQLHISNATSSILTLSSPSSSLILSSSGAGTGAARVIIGAGRAGNGESSFDLIADPTNPFSFRFVREAGIDGNVNIANKGTGSIYIGNLDSGTGQIVFYTSGVYNRLVIDSNGNVGIGTTTPTNTLQVGGTGISTTNITASSLPNVSQHNVVGYDSSTGRFTYMPTSSITSSSPTLIQTLTANVTVGGVSSGTSFNSGSQLEQVLRSILITFIPATISSLSLRNGGSNASLVNRDVNSSFTIDTASFTATADNPNNRLPQSASITSSNADTDFQHYLSDTLTTSNAFGLGFSRTINKASTSGTITFTVRALRPDNGSIISTTTNVSFLFRNYLAASSTVVSDNSTAQTVIDANVGSILASSKYWTATCTAANNNASNYTYIIYPASYGDLSNVIQNGALSVLTAFTSLGNYTITTPTYGASVSMRFYKSNSPGAFAAATSLVIT